MSKDLENDDGFGDLAGTDGEKIDVSKDSLMDINKYRFNKKLSNFLYSTCPLVPKFHASFGQPVER